MNRISELRLMAERAAAHFDEVCRPYYPDGRWGAYRAFECDQETPSDVDTALDAYHAATHAYYVARDGVAGFLGSKGA